MDEANVNRAILKAVLEKAQNQLIEELCGKKYARNRKKSFVRAGTARRTLMTRFGKVKFRVVKVRSLENGSIFRPFLLYMGLESRKRLVDDFVFECAEVATHLTYRDAKTVIEKLTKAEVSRHRVHSCVQRIGTYVEEKRGEAPDRKADLLYGDGTKVHGLRRKNEVNVVLGRDMETGEKHLLALTVNRNWRETAEQVEVRGGVLVADADRAMRKALAEKAMNYQLCVNHAQRETSIHLWKAGLPKKERREILRRLGTILRTCRNSATKHLEDGDMERLEWRINRTLEELRNLAEELVKDGLTAAAKFIRGSANCMVTFARLAMKGINIPHTNNLIERLMGEIAKRVKNRWMHWSTTGLENLLNILLARYCNNQLYNKIKERYLSQEKTFIQITVT